MVEGGEQEVAAIVSDFYTTNFKETFTEWLKSIPTYPKPIEMFMGTMSELLNMNYKLLFPFDISDAADGCFSKE
ncbi:Hypp8048 [Branchiostoma lanceolatum]|uniref:Hypp8048 protein n=1 Tax=Branchiostoma lanceolatum TaxID=7740 RepID=A0A8J9Z5V7_BRALA|nr:Hypp8048 [Branchiostoma lanceolatum]